MGRGGTNRSDFVENSVEECPIELLSGREPVRVHRFEICALVSDMLYLRSQDDQGKKGIFTRNHREKGFIMTGNGIAYDTISAARVSLILAQKGKGVG